MSHTVQIQKQLKDAAAVRAACQRLNLPAPVQGKVTLWPTLGSSFSSL